MLPMTREWGAKGESDYDGACEALPQAPGVRTTDAEDIFGETRPFMLDVENVDDSRDAIYTRMKGE